MDAKVCKKCNKEKNVLDFYKSDGKCKPCRREQVKSNREKNAEYYKEYDKKRYKNDPRVKARHKRYQSTEAGRAASNKAKSKWNERNAVKRGASAIVNNAIKRGEIIKPDSCECCGESNLRVEGHHDDYAKPLDVRWLCCSCHTQWHRENGEGKNGG